LNGFRVEFRMSLCNEGLLLFSVKIDRPDCGDLDYDLGYLRHGSFGRLLPMARQIGARACWMRWPGLPAGGAL